MGNWSFINSLGEVLDSIKNRALLGCVFGGDIGTAQRRLFATAGFVARLLLPQFIPKELWRRRGDLPLRERRAVARFFASIAFGDFGQRVVIAIVLAVGARHGFDRQAARQAARPLGFLQTLNY